MFDRSSCEQQEGTPRKQRKLNNVSTYEEDQFVPGQMTRRKSFMESLQFIGAVCRRDSFHINESKVRKSSVSHFSVADWDQLVNLQEAQEDSAMDEEAPLNFEDQDVSNLKLCKKFTVLNQEKAEVFFPDLDLKLYKNNSMFDPEDRANPVDNAKYGDNIYIQQILALERKATKKSKSSGTRGIFKNPKESSESEMDQQFSEDQNQRLLQDYQITGNIDGHVKHHENLLCLNKLERIFYYVKKINFSQDFDVEDLKNLCNLQIKLYNRDEEGHLVRFYQSWVEEDCIHLIFETASTSLEEKLENNLKLRESEVWSVLNDCSAGLEWMLNQAEQFHLNIKPGNIVKCRENYKLSDPFLNLEYLKFFVNSFQSQKDVQERVKLAYGYTAPEVINYRKLLTGLDLHKCDIYSLGICLLQNMTGIPVIILGRELSKIRKNNEKYLKGYSRALRNMLMRMVDSNPAKRPMASQICHINTDQPINSRKATPKRRFSV